MLNATFILKTLVVVKAFLFAGQIFAAATESSSRQGRFFDIVRLNPTQRFNIGIQITVPLSFFMPNFGTSGRQNRAFSLSEYRRSASVRQSRASLANACPTEKVELEDYLYMLQIDVESCQKRFICEVAADPKKFAPISDIFLKKIIRLGSKDERFQRRKRTSFHHQSLNNSSATTDDGWYKAARVGVNSHRKCHLAYGECPVAADSMINMNYLWMWQMVSRLTHIRFAGESDNSIFDY